MRFSSSYRFLGLMASLAMASLAHTQSLTLVDPSEYQYDAAASFEQPTFTASSTEGVLGSPGVSVFGGNGSIQALSADNPGVQVGYRIYNAANPWGLNASQSSAGVYTGDGGTQGLGIESLDSAGAPVTVRVSLGNTTSGNEYFGGYFTASTADDPNDPNNARLTYSFYDTSGNLITFADGTSSIAVPAYPATFNTTTGLQALQGVGFVFSGVTVGSVSITGESFAMDSLRYAQTANVVPEPASFAAVGLGLLVLVRRRKKA